MTNMYQIVDLLREPRQYHWMKLVEEHSDYLAGKLDFSLFESTLQLFEL